MIKLRTLPAMLAAVAVMSFSATTSIAQNSLLALKAPSATGNFLAGREAMRDLDTKRASSYYMDAAEGDWDNAAIIQRSFIALAADGRIGDAANMAQHLLEFDPTNELARVVIGAVALKERRYSSAENQLNGGEIESFLGITAGILRAWALVGDNQFEQSQALLNELAQGGLENFLVFHRAIMADVADKKDLALSLSAEAYDNEPSVARIVEARARILANASLFDEAQQVVDAFKEQGLQHALITKVEESIAAKKRPGKFAKNVQSGAAEMLHGIGGSLKLEGSNELAAVFLRLGLYLDPNAEVITIALAELLETSKRYEDANALYAQISKDSPLFEPVAVKVALNIDSMGDRAEAIRRLNNIAVAQPNNLEALTALADLQRFDQQYAESVENYTKAIELVGRDGPQSWRYFYTRGISLERSARWPEAEADFLAALKLNPDQPQVLNYLGYSWVDQGVHLDEALEMIERAIEWDPSDGYVVDSLGWAYYRLGRLDEAVQTLEQAVQLQPNSAEVNDHLGDAYWRSGRKLEARFQWRIAQDVDKDGKISEAAAKKLADGLGDPVLEN